MGGETLAYCALRTTLPLLALPLVKHAGGDQKRAKHIDIKYHYVREQVAAGTLDIVYCPTEDMLADILTKPLHPARHATLVALMLKTK